MVVALAGRRAGEPGADHRCRLLLTYTADQSTFPSTRDAWLAAAAGRIRNVDIVGGNHYLAGQPRPGAGRAARSPRSPMARTTLRARRAAEELELRAGVRAAELALSSRRPNSAPRSAVRYPIVIVGAGLGGPHARLRPGAARRRAPSLLDEDDTVGVRGASSRGICYAQKSLEIFDRLGIYERIARKGITWSVGRTFSGDQEVYTST